MISKKEISLEQARKIAENQARASFSGGVVEKNSLLQSFYLEAENCWMFFRDKKIPFSVDNQLGIEWAYVVSKHGRFSLVEDFSSDALKLHNYLKTMSDYFARTGG